MKKTILSLLEDIRGILYKKYRQNRLMTDMTKYNKCYSSIDLLEDITEAIDYYKECDESKLNLGAKYLMIYGVLEALYMQQKAIDDLYVALDYEKPNLKRDYPEILYIREVRNDVAGHPTSRTTAEYTTFLSRPDLSLKKIRYEETKNNTFIDFNIIENISIQENYIKNILGELLSKLEQAQKEHIENFKKDKLSDCFQMFCYAHEKVYSQGRFYTQNDNMGFNMVGEMIIKLKEKLNARFVNWENTDFAYDIKFVENNNEYLLSRPEIINEVSEENTFLKINLLENMFSHLEHLKDMAKEVDTDYENNFETKFVNDSVELPKILITNEKGEEVELNV